MAQERRSSRAPSDRSGEGQSSRRTNSRHRRSGSSAASFGVLYAVAVIGVSILLACVCWIAANDVLALNKPEKEVTITVDKEDSFNQVADRLKKEGLIEYKGLFKLFASVTGGKAKVSPGTYTLNTDMDYRALLSGMSVNSSTKAEITITIPEGYTVTQIFQLLEDNKVATVEELTQAAAEHDYAFSFLQGIPLGDAERLEGFLYPDTYQFNTPHNAVYAINTDRGKIASVIYNRLNNPSAGTMGYLQIDATLAFLNGGKVPTEADKAIDSPYNTYLYKGLPPAPIANPGLDAIKTALDPEKTGYFYYALGDDNTHSFFKTLDEQQRFLRTQTRYN